MGIVIKIVDWFTKNRNMLFLAVCLVIHVIYLCVFQILNVLPLVALNLFSSGFYFNFLVLKKDTSEKSMLHTYFEILLFSFLSELALGPDYGFFLYMIGLSSAVFYLVPSYRNARFLYQIIGIATAFILKFIVMVVGVRFPAMQSAVEPYCTAIFMFNMGITATIVLAATFFYSKETEKVLSLIHI